MPLSSNTSPKPSGAKPTASDLPDRRATPDRRRAGRPRKDAADQSHVQLRTLVRPDIAEAFKRKADEDGVAVSSLLRGVVKGYLSTLLRSSSN